MGSLRQDVVRLEWAGEAKKGERKVKSKVNRKVVLHFRQRSHDLEKWVISVLVMMQVLICTCSFVGRIEFSTHEPRRFRITHCSTSPFFKMPTTTKDTRRP